jgi:hypothetical protein
VAFKISLDVPFIHEVILLIVFNFIVLLSSIAKVKLCFLARISKTMFACLYALYSF